MLFSLGANINSSIFTIVIAPNTAKLGECIHHRTFVTLQVSSHHVVGKLEIVKKSLGILPTIKRGRKLN